MICPKCKSEIADTVLRCPICNTKVKMFCPHCRSLIKFGLKKCNICGSELLKKCKNCGSINLASENICRKCKKPVNIVMEQDKQPISQENIYPAKEQETNLKKSDNKDDISNEVPANEEISNQHLEEAESKPSEVFEMNIADNIDISNPNYDVQNQEKAQIQVKYYNQPEAKDRLFAALKDDKKHIVALSGTDGYGKTTVIKQLIPMLNKDNIYVMFCECTPNTQLAPFGAIQSAFRKYLSLPDFYANEEIFETNFAPVIANAFQFLTKTELHYLNNFLYNTEQSYYESILINQNSTYSLLDKIITNLSEIYPFVFIADSFDLIDAASYKYLMSLIKRGMINSQVKLLLSYKENVHVQSYLNFINEDENVYENIFLKKLSAENFDNLVKFFLNGVNPIPESINKQIIRNSDYNAGYIEQAIFYLNDLNAFVVENDTIKFSTDAYEISLPENYEKIVAQRVNNLSKNSSQFYDFLVYASLLGHVFSAKIVQNIMNLPDDTTNHMINLLINSGYIIPYQNTDFSFRNSGFWKQVYDIVKKDENFANYNQKLHVFLSSIEYYNLSMKALFAQNIEENFLAFNMWTQNIKIAAAVGDIDLYILSQKQCLKLLDEFSHTNGNYIKNNINERVGKLTYKSNPVDATEYLTNAMSVYHQNGNIIKAIELSGFLLKAQKITDNALTSIEIIDNVLKIMPQNGYELEKALIKAKKLDALLKIGNYDELINLTRNEIIPVLETNLAKKNPHKRYSHEMLFDVWINSAKDEANAYSLQGNDRALEVISTIEDVLNSNNRLQEDAYSLSLEIAKALAYTTKGQLDFSDEILKEVNLKSSDISLKDLSMANLVKIINKILRFDYMNIKEDLFEAATFANNCNDNVLKNIYKTLLAKVIKEEGNAQKAMDIYNEQVTYFAGEKISAGAFLCWYFMSELFLLTEGPDKALEIAMKSLEITKNPKIMNINFMIMFKKLIAEIYLIKHDFDATKMYIEKALLTARKFGLDYHVMTLYHLYGKYFEEIITSKTSNDNQIVQNSFKMYEKANDIAKELNIQKYIVANNDEKQSLQVFCKLNGINLD